MRKFYSIALVLLALFLCDGLLAQVSGRVISSDDELGIPGVSVVVKGTTVGTVTDLDGNYNINASDGDVLIFSFVGMLSQEATVNGNTVGRVSLSEDATSLSEMVVTATRQPVRKIKTTTAITSLGSGELATIQPESIAEAITSVPGVTVENSQGRKANYNIRGFPSGNTYVTTLLDGLPLNGFASRSAGVTEFQGIDKNVERVEVVRGSGATLFGRAAGAGAVNLVSRTAGDEFTGGVSLTAFNTVVEDDLPTADGLDRRIDYYLSGPISDKIGFSLGGFHLEDSGIKEWAIKDRGNQISANLDFNISENTTIRVYGMFGNNQYNNLTDSPYDLGRESLPDGWTNANTYYADNSQLNFPSTLVGNAFVPGSPATLDVNGREIIQNQADENREEVEGGMIGISAEIGLTEGLSVVGKFRTSQYDWRDHNEITFTSFYGIDDRILRLNANSQGDISDFLGEVRFNYELKGDVTRHNFSIGTYFSSAEYDRFGGLHWYTADVNPRPTYGFFGPPGTPPPNVFSLSSTTSHQEESVVAFFVGDEMEINDNLRINVGLRTDRMEGFFNNDPEVVAGIDYAPAELVENELDFSNWSASIGANYLFDERTALYGSVVRAFSLPSVGLSTPLPEDDEIVVNTELGFRYGVGDLGIDVAVFNTTIDNRVASVFDPDPATGQTFVNRPVGKNTVRGGELQLTYAPLAVKGLVLRSSFTLQQSEFDGLQIALSTFDDDDDETTPEVPVADLNNLFGLDLVELDPDNGLYAIDVTGNQVHNTPTRIFAFNAGYNARYFGGGFDLVNYGGRFATSLNLYETPDFTQVNANIYARFPFQKDMALKLGLRIKNLFDSDNPQQIVIGSTTDDELIQRQATPNYDGVLSFATIQPPRRILLTLGFEF